MLNISQLIFFLIKSCTHIIIKLWWSGFIQRKSSSGIMQYISDVLLKTANYESANFIGDIKQSSLNEEN